MIVVLAYEFSGAIAQVSGSDPRRGPTRWFLPRPRLHLKMFDSIQRIEY